MRRPVDARGKRSRDLGDNHRDAAKSFVPGQGIESGQRQIDYHIGIRSQRTERPAMGVSRECSRVVHLNVDRVRLTVSVPKETYPCRRRDRQARTDRFP